MPPARRVWFVDRLLTQLILSGSLDGVSGLVLGSFEGDNRVELVQWPPGHADGISAADVMDQR